MLAWFSEHEGIERYATGPQAGGGSAEEPEGLVTISTVGGRRMHLSAVQELLLMDETLGLCW